MKKLISLLSICLFAVTACGGGGSDGDDLSTNACSAIGLPTKNVRIINGTACGSLSSSPVVRVIVLDSSGDPIGLCSGTMITPNDVLTAAHCIIPGTAGAAVVYGESESSNAARVSRIVRHPEYRPVSRVGETFAAFNDIAIFSLDQNLNLPTLPLLSSSFVESGEEISIFGYGTDENGNLEFRELKSGEMLVSDVTDNHISTVFNGDGSNTCQGDSGGPAVSNKTGAPAIAGVTSTGTNQGCGEGDNSLFINISGSRSLNFILSVVPDAQLR